MLSLSLSFVWLRTDFFLKYQAEIDYENPVMHIQDNDIHLLPLIAVKLPDADRTQCRTVNTLTMDDNKNISNGSFIDLNTYMLVFMLPIM